MSSNIGGIGSDPSLTKRGGEPTPDLSQFFGPVNKNWQREDLNPDDRYPHETFNLPEAYHGKNRYLERALNFLITSDDDWYTRYVLPWEQTDQIHVAWDVWSFDRTMADLEPHQGVPRYVTAERESHSDSLLRRGLAFIIEHGFYTTQEGQEHYLLNLKQITEAVHETVYYGVIHALLLGKDYWKEWQKTYGRKATCLDDMLRRERRQWACVQKQTHGLQLLDAELKDMFKNQQVYPDTWILPTKMAIYATMVPEVETEYYRKGPGAVANLELGPDNMKTFRGSRVFETRPFDIDMVDRPVNLLHRQSQIGEYYLMSQRSAVMAGDKYANGESYMTDHRSIYIYSMGSDRFEKITMMDALYACGRANNGGDFAADDLLADHKARGGQIPTNDQVDKANNGDLGPTYYPPDLQVKWVSYLTGEVTLQWVESLALAPACHKRPTGDKDNGRVQVFEGFDLNQALYDNHLSQDARGVVDNPTAFKTAWAGNADQLKRLSADTNTTGADAQLQTVLGRIFRSDAGSEAKAHALNTLVDKTLKSTSKASFRLSNVDDWIKSGASFVNAGAPSEFKRLKGGHTVDGRSTIEVDKGFMTDCQARLKGDKPFPYDFLICRPFMTYTMASAIFLKGGKELGSTFHGHHDFQLTDDVLHKVHIGHYTFYSKSIVKAPKNYTIVEDIFSQGYVCGEDTTFYTDQSEFDNDINSGQMKKSILAFMIPGNSLRTNNDNARRVTNPLSVTGRFEPSIYSENDVTPGEQPNYPSAPYYNRFWELQNLENFQHSANQAFAMPFTTINSMCFEGMQYYYDPATRDFTNKVLNTGHWGKNVYPGVKAVRCGENAFMRDCNFCVDKPY